MEIKKISCDKIVVRLNDNDLENFDIDMEKRIPQAEDLHRFMYKVMELVRLETGFDPYNGGQVVVEAQALEDGIKLIISKIRTGTKKITYDNFLRAKSVRPKRRFRLPQEDIPPQTSDVCDGKRKRTYIIEEFCDLEAAIAALEPQIFQSASLYKRNRGYALVFDGECKGIPYNILSEYSISSTRNSVIAHRVKESWDKIADGAELVRMAREVKEMNM